MELIGRLGEVAALERARASVDTVAVVLSGTAGVGKTRLVADVSARWEAEGMRVLRVFGTTSAASIPFGAVAHLVPAGPAPMNQVELLRALADEIRGPDDSGRTVLVVDDAHALDPASAALVHRVVLDGAALAILTMRSGEPAEEAVTRVARDRATLRIRLGPLSNEDMRRLVEGELVTPVELRSRDRLVTRAAGNPLRAAELVRAGIESGVLAQARGVWRLGGPLPPPGPLGEVLAARLAGLARAERRALGLVAMAEPLALGTLEALTDRATVTELERRRLVRVERDTGRARVHFGHPLLGDVLRTEIGRHEAHGLKEQLSSAFTGRGPRRRAELLAVAQWHLDSGVPADGELLWRGARAAHAAFDRELAARIADAALEAGAGITAAVPLAVALSRLNRFAEAEETLAPFEAEAAGHALAHEYLTERIFALDVGLGRRDEALALLRRAHRWPGDRVWRERVTAWEMTILLDVERFEEVAERGLPLFEPGVDQTAMLTAGFSVPLALMFIGRTEEAQAIANGCIAPAFERAGDIREIAMLALTTGVAVQLETAKDWDAADQFLAMAVQVGMQWPNDELAGLLGVAHARLSLNRGRITTALRHLQQAEPRIRLSDPRALHGVVLSMMARAHATLGDLTAAHVAHQAASDVLARRTTRWLDVVEAVRAEVWIVAASGEPRRAAQLAIDRAPELAPMPLHEITIWHEALRLGSRTPAVFERIGTLAGRIDSPLSQAYAEHAAALRHGDPVRMEEAARTFERLGAHLLAAEGAIEAAAEQRRRGRDDSARRCALLGDRLADLTEGARTPVLDSRVGDGLTAREREVATLASRGRTNHEIAEQLGLSRRTVESHLHRVFGKLDLRRREELEGLL